MELENGVSERVPAFNGQKSSYTEALTNPADCEKILNFVTRRARLRKIWGATLYANPDLNGGSGEVKWIDRIADRWVHQHGRVIALEDGDSSQEYTKIGEIGSGILGRVMSAKWQNRLFLVNGAENKFIEINQDLGTLYLSLGLYPPGLGRRVSRFVDASSGFVTATPDGYPYGAIPELSDIGSGSLPNATYKYRITWFDSVRGIESLPNGSEVNEDGLWYDATLVGEGILAASGGTSKIRVNISKLKAIGYDSRVTHFRVYREAQADGVYKCVNVQAATATTAASNDGTPIAEDYFDDSVSEANLGQVLDLSISPPPSGKYNVLGGPEDAVGDYGPRFVEFFRDQLWMFGARIPGTQYGVDTESQPDAAVTFLFRRARFYPQTGIAYGSEVGNPDYWKYTYDIGRASGQRDTGMKKHGNVLMFFKERSAYYLLGSSPENYEIAEMDPDRGFTVPGSICSTPIGVIGLGEGGFTIFKGVGRGEIISEDIADEVERINLAYADKITCAFDPEEEKYECHVPQDSSTYNDTVFIYDLKSRSWSFTKRAGGAAAYALSSSKRTVGLIGDARNGKLYLSTDRSAVTFNGQTMHGVWRSKHFDFNRPGELKNLQVVKVTARAKRDFRISVDIVVDNGQRDAITVKDIDPDVRQDLLGASANDAEGALWNEGQWAADTVKKTFTILTPCIGEKFQLILRNSDTDADRARFEVEEIKLEASALDGDDD